jgi:hypothetical protein
LRSEPESPSRSTRSTRSTRNRVERSGPWACLGRHSELHAEHAVAKRPRPLGRRSPQRLHRDHPGIGDRTSRQIRRRRRLTPERTNVCVRSGDPTSVATGAVCRQRRFTSVPRAPDVGCTGCHGRGAMQRTFTIVPRTLRRLQRMQSAVDERRRSLLWLRAGQREA